MPVPEIPVNGWYEVPNSKLAPLVMESAGSGTKDDVMISWSGGVFDTRRNRLLVHGGGGQGQQDNGIFAFSLDTLTWTRETPANSYWTLTPRQQPQDTNPDGTPASIHSYGGLVYLPWTDEFVRIGGARWHDDYTLDAIFTYAFESSAWRLSGSTQSKWLGFAAATDPLTRRIYFWDYMRVRYYRPTWINAWPFTNDHWTSIDDGMNAVIDPDRRKLWFFGKGQALSVGLDDAIPATLTSHTTTGNLNAQNSYAPGLAYDPNLKKVVAWTGWQYVFTFDPDTRVWTRYNASTSTTPVSPVAHGVWGRFQYVPTLNLYVGVDSVFKNVWLYRLTADPPPPPSPPSTLPANEWVRRELPPPSGTYSDTLPSSPVGGIKHLRLRYNPHDQKIYVFGGDHSGGWGFWSDGARQEVYTYDVTSDQWAKVHPRCLASGVQPLSPDQVLVDYDTKRRIFWLLSDEIVPDVKCSTGVSQPSDKIFSFDPLTNRYTVTTRKSLTTAYESWRGSVKNWTYDPDTDKLYAFSTDAVFAYTIEGLSGGEWWNWLSIPGDGRQLGHSYVARGNRWLYTVDLYASRFYRWDIDTRTLEDLGPMPISTGNIEEEAHGLIAWNETAQRIMFTRANRLFAFDPTAKTWTELPPKPDGSTTSNNVVWDATNNALVTFGGLSPTSSYIYLYRYVP